MELQVSEIKALEPIKFNYEDIKKWLTAKAKEYKDIVYTPETITLAKQDRATLNKVSSAINDEKKRIKNELLKPYVDFENKCKELMSIVDDASKTIDVQVKEFELKEQTEKQKQIKVIFEKYIGDFKEVMNLDMIFNPRWLNKTYTMKKIEEDIQHTFTKAKTDLGVIDTQFTDENIRKQVKISYFNNISNPNVLTLAILDGNTIIENNKKLDELYRTQEAKKEINASKNKQDAPMQVTEEKMEINFKVIATKEQFMVIKSFFEKNNIKYGRI